jgi:hypothetical protein
MVCLWTAAAALRRSYTALIRKHGAMTEEDAMRELRTVGRGAHWRGSLPAVCSFRPRGGWWAAFVLHA